MKYFTVDLKDEFPQLKTGNPRLHCYINDCYKGGEGRKTPAMLAIAGGGYGGVCFDREGEPIAFCFLKEGYSAFALEYSVAPAHFPTQLLEAAAAMIYIRRNAEKWSINPDWVAVSGYSAGGHLAASLGTLCLEGEVEKAFSVDPHLAIPNAMVLSYSVITSDPSFSHSGSIENVTGNAPVGSELYKKVSLENHVNGSTPPAYIWHTANDELVPVKNSLAFAAALADHGIKYELHVFPNGSHGLATSSFATHDGIMDPVTALSHKWVSEAAGFLNTVWFGNPIV